MPKENLMTATDVASELTVDLSNVFERLGESAVVAAGNTNHGINNKCCGYFTDINGILKSYSRSAVKDAEKIALIDSQLTSLDDELEAKME